MNRIRSSRPGGVLIWTLAIVPPPYLGPFDGCIPGWRAAIGLAMLISGLGLALFSIRRMNGWLALFSWLWIWAGILIALTGHYPCADHPTCNYHQSFQHSDTGVAKTFWSVGELLEAAA